MAADGEAVFATLLMNENYLPGAMVLGHSLRDKKARGKLVVFVLLEKLTPETLTELKTIYDDVVPVQEIVNTAPANLYLMNRPDLIHTFTKVEMWKQTQYKRIVYLDADMVTLRAPNELLTLDTNFAAVPDIGWPDCFNSGLMVFNPNLGDYYALLALARRGISFDGADQGLLNMHFTDWDRLSFAYNCTPSANYQYLPAYKHFQSSISGVHFIGGDKPWTQGRENNKSYGAYGEMLGRWWAVYDKHYQRPRVTYYSGQPIQTTRKVQDYVRGEETIYEAIRPDVAGQSSRSQTSSAQATSGQDQRPPGVHHDAPVGDSPGREEQIRGDGHKSTSASQQRRFSAPHAEWEPARQPPPPNSKPEASNFPSQQYEMSQNRALFEPPPSYPSPPKDMWYKVPEKAGPAPKPKPIFPWEQRMPKATRVFPQSREPSPPPAPSVTESASKTQVDAGSSFSESTDVAASSGEGAAADAPSSTPPSLPEPPRHIFPWESRAPKATRVFPQEHASSPPISAQQPVQTDEVTTPSAVTDASEASSDTVLTPRPSENPWDAFQQRNVNAWDDMPEINRYMESINRPRKAGIQVLHHTPRQSTPGSQDITSPPIGSERRPSLRLTDFPTAIERPSLPVTPAPIRRGEYLGDGQGGHSELPPAEGVPIQEEWVRRFSSYPTPDFRAASFQTIDGVVVLECQQCGHQNPIAKLEELSRRQSEILTGQVPLGGAKTPPTRDMPENLTREQAVAAAMKATTPEQPSTRLKPILKEPKIGVLPPEEQEQLNPQSTRDKAPTSKSLPTSPSPAKSHGGPVFNPITLVGEAASSKKGTDNGMTSEEAAAIND